MRKKVLIVEDEIFVALEIEQIVEDAGFNVGAIAADREAALACADTCDIALVDLNLRDGPTGPAIGMELAAHHGVRVIYVTANPAQIGPASVAALGVITKPFRAHSIVAALRMAAADTPEPSATAITGFIPFAPSDSLNGAVSRG
ncbi:response regulator [Sphingobium sp. Ant17]|jgi:DNA-binding response OmpR family regulator|uniref:response regulator n=1 Tax=Sphingobium sp. Ant17 TaxID=1461752 RepID=UPI00044ACF8C|nr:response regulator [Sphingobium sp. Ant17]EXS68538.1 response regulator [Sphingobium sp. Ant17]|tara:strand:- start:25484 stop:25918 length:435 start_codon:yes stop_codon:yes gene_type:complete